MSVKLNMPSSYKISVKNEDGIDSVETVDSNAPVGSREFRLAALLSYLSIEDSVKVLNLIDLEPTRKENLLRAIDISFVLSIAAQEINNKPIENNDIEYALVKVGIDPDEIKI
jgi:hypothetical protein